jgi:hypothetical protein
MTEKRQYSKAEKATWGAEQDRICAAGGIKAWRAQQGISEPTPAKRQSRTKLLIADTSESECFDSLVYRKGLVTAVFSKGGGAGTYEYEMSLAEAREWSPIRVWVSISTRRFGDERSSPERSGLILRRARHNSSRLSASPYPPAGMN